MRMNLTGQVFGYRDRPRARGEPLRPVEVVEMGPPPRHQVRVRWVTGEEAGTTTWVSLAHLVVPWADAEAFLADERRFEALYRASKPGEGSAAHRAVDVVLRAVAPGVEFGWYYTRERALLRAKSLEAAALALGLPAEVLRAEPLAYVDRFGLFRAALPAAERWAQELCRRMPERVLAAVAEEEAAVREGIRTGLYGGLGEAQNPQLRDQLRDTLQEREPAWRLVREWCGEPALTAYDELSAWRAEAERLRGELEALAVWLREHGHTQKAVAVLRAVRRGSAG